MAQRIVDVLVPVALDHAYSYRAPAELDLNVGDIVSGAAWAPRGARRGLGRRRPVRPGLHNRLKDVAASSTIRRCKRRAAPVRRLGRELHVARARHGAAHDPAHGRAWTRARTRRRAARRSAAAAHDAGAPRVLAALADGLLRAKSEAAKEAGVSAGVMRVDRRRHAGNTRVAARTGRAPARSGLSRPELTDAQRRRPTRCAARPAAASRSTLLDGVTGSGKTEVYFEAIAETIRAGRQALILMPEIALTAQFLDRFAGVSACARPNGIRTAPSQARARLERGRGGRGECRGRRALGAVPALRGPRPDRGR